METLARLSLAAPLKTLTISCGIEILPNLEKTRDAQPDFRVLTDERTEIGAGWTRTGQSSGGNMSRCPSQRRNSATAACSPISARPQARTTRTSSPSSGTRTTDPGRAVSTPWRRRHPDHGETPWGLFSQSSSSSRWPSYCLVPASGSDDRQNYE